MRELRDYDVQVFIDGRFERPESGDGIPVLDKAAGVPFGSYGNAYLTGAGSAVLGAVVALFVTNSARRLPRVAAERAAAPAPR